MKKIYTTFLFTIMTAAIFAQSFTIPVADTVLNGDPTDQDFYALLAIENNTGGSLNMHWKVIEDSMPTEWQFSVCDPINCHPIGLDSSNFSLATGPGKTVNVHFYPNDTEGTGKVVFQVYEQGKPDSAITVTYYGHAYAPEDTSSNTTAVGDLLEATSLIQWNHEHNSISIKSTNKTQIVISDLSGRNVLYSKAENELYLGNLNQGIYIVSLIENGQLLLDRRKIVIR